MLPENSITKETLLHSQSMDHEDRKRDLRQDGGIGRSLCIKSKIRNFIWKILEVLLVGK